MGSLWEVARFINLSFGRTAGCLRRLEPGAVGGGAIGMQERQRRWDGFGVGEERDIIKGHPRLCPDLSILTSWGAGDAFYRRGRLRKELYGRNVVSAGTFSAWHVHQTSQWKGQVGSLISESGTSGFTGPEEMGVGSKASSVTGLGFPWEGPRQRGKRAEIPRGGAEGGRERHRRSMGVSRKARRGCGGLSSPSVSGTGWIWSQRRSLGGGDRTAST